MRVEGSRFVRAGRHAVLAALASVLLASCTTSSNQDEFFGFSASAHAPIGTSVQDVASLAVGDDASVAPADSVVPTENAFVIEEGDPLLPDMVAAAPVVRPVSPEEHTALAEMQQAEASQPPQSEAAPEQVAAAVQGEAAPETVQAEPVAFAPAAEQPKKAGFFANLFGNRQQQPQQSVKPLLSATPPSPEPVRAGQQVTEAESPATPLVQLAAVGQPPRPLAAASAAAGQSALPGVRQNSLYEISRRSGIEEDDIDVYEDEPVQVASAAGLARLAPNGLLKQTEHVDVACLKPSLVRTLKTIEKHFGGKVTITSGYRSPTNNRRARGARNSLHMYCAAADVKVEGVSKAQLASFARSMPGRGGVGTYCHTDAVHIDVGPERDWNWRCRRRK